MPSYAVNDSYGTWRCRVKGLTVHAVSGPKIRDHLSVEFAAGGHGYVYKYVPKDEVWIEDINTLRDQRMVLAHELIEREFMKVRGWTYKKAHALANKLEQLLRNGAPPMATFFAFMMDYGCYRSERKAKRQARWMASVLRNY